MKNQKNHKAKLKSMNQEQNSKEPVLVLEDIDNGRHIWGISFQDPNPEALYYFRMPDKETAFRLQKAIHEYAQQREQPWVRVETKPESFIDLWLFIPERDHYPEEIIIGYYESHEDVFISSGQPINGVTHYKIIPLPAPPKD